MRNEVSGSDFIVTVWRSKYAYQSEDAASESRRYFAIFLTIAWFIEVRWTLTMLLLKRSSETVERARFSSSAYPRKNKWLYITMLCAWLAAIKEHRLTICVEYQIRLWISTPLINAQPRTHSSLSLHFVAFVGHDGWDRFYFFIEENFIF